MGEPTMLAPVTDRSPFSLHPEDWVTQRDSHDEEGAYLKRGLRLLLPDCCVARDLAVYWVPGETQHPYAGPDIFVSRHKPQVEDPSVWLTYEDGPLALVIEIASEKTRHLEAKRRDETYAQALQVPEYVYMDPQQDDLRLGRLVEGRYEWIAPDAAGRFWSEQFQIGFVRQQGERLVRLVRPDESVVPTAQEEHALRQAAEERAAREARRAEQEAMRAAREARRAQQEAARAQQEAACADQEASRAHQAAARAEQEAARAEQEARQRAAAEQRAQELAAEVEQLRRRLAEDGPPGESST